MYVMRRTKRKRSFNDKWFDIALKEYEVRVHEGMMGAQNAFTALSVGFTVILALFAAAMYSGSTANPQIENLKPVVLQILIPLTCFLTGMLWLSEIGRMLRAGVFVGLLEDRFSEMFPFDNHGFPGERKSSSVFSRYPSPAFWHKWLWSKPSSDQAQPQGRVLVGNLSMCVLWIFIAVTSSTYSWFHHQGGDLVLAISLGLLLTLSILLILTGYRITAGLKSR